MIIDADYIGEDKQIEDLRTSAIHKKWVKIPIMNGFVKFKVRTRNCAKIALTTDPELQTTMIEIELSNERSKISLNYNGKSFKIIEVCTPNILNASEFREFWILWVDNEVFVMKGNEEYAFMSLKYIPYSIYYIGTYTNGFPGTWYFEDKNRVETRQYTEYSFRGIRRGYLEISYKGESDAHVALLSTGELCDPMVEINLGVDSNAYSSIRLDNFNDLAAQAFTPVLLSDRVFTRFCIQWQNGHLWIRKHRPDGPLILKGRYCADFIVKYFAVRSGQKVNGKWIFRPNKNCKPPVRLSLG